MGTTFRFLQFSDVHLDSRLTGSHLAWPREKRDIRRQEIADLIPKVCAMAREREVEAVLIPGDLWDDETISAETLHRVIEAFARLDPIPIYIAPGNHDFYSSTSFYNDDILRARGMRPWPKNVTIFRSGDFQTVLHPMRPDVTITGRAFLQNVPLTERLLRTPIPRPPAPVSILLFHGSWTEYRERDRFDEGKVSTAPFSREELLAQGFSYAALGHYHHYAEIVDDAGRVRAAYSGCPAGRYLSESGEHYVLLGEITDRGVEKLEKIVVDHRTIRDVEVDVTGAGDEPSVRERIARKLKESGAAASDIVFLRLKGRIPRGLPAASLAREFQREYFHLAVADSTRPDYDLDDVDPRTTQGRFIREMRRLIEEERDERKRALLERALYYGLDALLHGKVDPIYDFPEE
jgi:DNA repair exonuclease SbcCD nuclease subunit